jgi:hypothetical protein
MGAQHPEILIASAWESEELLNKSKVFKKSKISRVDARSLNVA